jgi:hypothetical protein
MTHYDSPWKEAIGLYFEQFLEFFFPEIHPLIDWSKPYELLDTELQGIARDAEHGRREADLLIRLTLLDGQSALIHAEVQSQPDDEFGKRVLLYHTRIADKFGRPLCSLAILGDFNPEWRPERHAEGFGGCLHQLRFPMRKLLDFPDWAKQPHNVFSWLSAAHLKAQSTRGKPARRAEAKIKLVRGLYNYGLTRSEIVRLFRLLDWVLALPKQMEYDFRQELYRFEEEQKMVYVTSIERMAREEGLEQGLKQGLKQGQQQACQALVSQIIERATQQWGALDSVSQTKLEQIDDLSRLVQLLALVCGTSSAEEFQLALG